MNSPAETSNLSPIRIYILWHPGFDNRDEFKERDLKTLTENEKARLDRGLKLARRIYHWFRTETMEGIPVYFRSTPADESTGTPLEIDSQAGVRNYIIPLVDANMVSCPEWRRYVANLAVRNDDSSIHRIDSTDGKNGEYRVLPVAMDSVAYNMPESMRKLNFIRHIPRENKPQDDMELLARLTEVLCRDLRYWLQRAAVKKCEIQSNTPAPAAVPGRIKIFLSHAKADDTDEAIAIKEYIQRETQCEAFFDETDIPSSYDYGQILEGAIGGESAGLVVIQGDNYADRPWCRKEIRDFLNPTPDPLANGTDRIQFFIRPVVVVQTMKGKQIGRTIPELGYSPCVRWQGDAARFVVTTLLREILFGLFYRTLADRIASLEAEVKTVPSGTPWKCVYINRAPDPVMVNRIMKQLDTLPPEATTGSKEIVHPGYGLSNMEKAGLESAARDIRFSSFLERSAPPRPNNTHLAGRIIAVSAGNPGDITSRGMGDEHIQELLVRLLRPLLAQQASLLYGGVMPDNIRPAEPWNEQVNYTGALLQLLITERNTSDAALAGIPPRLYIPKPWNERQSITVHEIAQWTDICSFIPISASDSGIDPSVLPICPAALTEDDFDGLSDREKRELRQQHENEEHEYSCFKLALKALCLSGMRRKICDPHDPLHCELPDSPVGSRSSHHIVRPLAHILIGGKTHVFTGAMPGVFEEALCAFESRNPVFLIPEAGGASAVLAKWLVNFSRKAAPPRELTVNFHIKHKRYAAFLAGLRHEAFAGNIASPPADLLSSLWGHISKAKNPKSLAELLNNGLSGDDNIRLLTSSSSIEICGLVWKGLDKLAARTDAH